MKKTILLSLAILLFACNQKQEEKVAETRKVPQTIEDAFKKLHPTATILKWNDEPPIWEAKYQEDKEKGAVSFDSIAHITETELVIAESELQNLPSIPKYIKENYPTEVIKGCEKIDKQNSVIIYEIQITGKELLFDNTGKFLSEELD
jgi:hypothetical protein